MGALEHGGYLQITAAWQQIPFASATPTSPLQAANSVGRRRFIYATQPIWISGDSSGSTKYFIPANTQYETTTRAPLWFSASTAPATLPTTSSSSSVTVPTLGSSSSSTGIVTTYGFLFAAEEGT
jgi:hypothetical protein